MGITRRDFLKTIVVTAGGASLASLPGCNNTEINEILASIRSEFFPQSVASGDPKPSSVILWTRIQIADLVAGLANITTRLQVATDEEFNDLLIDTDIEALAEDDYALRIKVTGLDADTHYYYRFGYLGSDTDLFVSRTGRTRTAPATDSTRDIKYALANCQDYIGRFYNAYLPLLEEENDDLDFVVHVGDYIYETNGNPQFQNVSEDRLVAFDDTDGAISLGDFEAAASLDNYRQLYRTYRSDPVLQQVHERFPFICLWDDHEFSNDHHEDIATYFNGRVDEQDIERKRNAERAWLEFMPFDDGADADDLAANSILDTNEENLFPNFVLFRDLQFGQNLHLLLSDTRSYRPDHLIPEDGFPGTVVHDQNTIAQALAAVGQDEATINFILSQLLPYVAFESLEATVIQPTIFAIVQGAYQAEGLTEEEAQARTAAVLTGNLDITYLNLLINFAGNPIPAIDPTGAEQGLSYFSFAKTGLFSELGSRAVVTEATFNLFTFVNFVLNGGATPDSEDLVGETQQDFMVNTLAASTANWKIVANSISNTSVIIDFDATDDGGNFILSDQTRADLAALGLPSRLYLNTEHWDGFPSKRHELLEIFRTLSSQGGQIVLLAGDIHAGYVTNHTSATGPLFEFTANAISSETLADILQSAIQNDPNLSQVTDVDTLVANIDEITDPAGASDLAGRVNQNIVFNESDLHGVVIATVSADVMTTNYVLFPSEVTEQSFYANPQAALDQTTTLTFTVDRTAATLTQELPVVVGG